MRVLVCGGRYFRDFGRVRAHLDALHDAHGFSILIHGGATGADKLAGRWADEASDPIVGVVIYPAQWARRGRMAGPVRNIFMLRDSRPDLVVAFKGGAGTAGMIDLAEEAGVRVVRCWDDD